MGVCLRLCSATGKTFGRAHFSSSISWVGSMDVKLDRGDLPRLVVEQPAFPDGPFAFHFEGAAIETYLAQASSNLYDWTSISTNSATSNTTFHILARDAAAYTNRFYRVFLP